MKDNKGFVELEGRLTSLGKIRVLENRFNITKYAVSDDGINYRLINQNLIDPYLALDRSLMFNKNNDSTALLKNRINISRPDTLRSALYDFDINVDKLNVPVELYPNDVNMISNTEFDNIKVNPIGFNDEINFPLLEKNREEDEISYLRYYITNADVANQVKDVSITIPISNLPSPNDPIGGIGNDGSGNNSGAIQNDPVGGILNGSGNNEPNLFNLENDPVSGGISNPTQGGISIGNEVSITLHEAKYFDIRLMGNDSGKYNWGSSYKNNQKDPYQDIANYPKTITIVRNQNINNSIEFILRYKGEFKFSGKSRSDFASYDEFINNTNIYQTFLTIRCEKTGHYQDVCLQLIKSESKTEQ